MTRHTSPHNQKTVPVLNKDGTPLAPTRPSRARRWLESGKATKEWQHGLFAVRLTEQYEDPKTPDTSLNIDPGAKVTGIAIANWNINYEAIAVAVLELHHRSYNISKRMKERSSHRRNRRSRLRRRPARFLNRTRKDGWLPPSLFSRLANIITTVRHLRGLFPVNKLLLETNRFDPRLLRDPDIEGIGYQYSERGRMQIREYVLQRDKRTCQYQQKCRGGKTQILQIDHIIPRSQGGANRIDNLITSCKACNDAKGSKSLEEFLALDPDRRKRIRQQLKKPMASATHMNQIIPLLGEALVQTGLPLRETDAVSTAHARKELHIPKTHVNDALCLGEPRRVRNLPERITIIRAVGHGRRQMLWPPNKYGTPRYREGAAGRNSLYRAYCRMPRSQQGFTTTPGHKLRETRHQGISSGDLVSYQHPVGGPTKGYAVLTNRNSRVGIGNGRTVQAGEAKLLARANGYRRTTATNTTKVE